MSAGYGTFWLFPHPVPANSTILFHTAFRYQLFGVEMPLIVQGLASLSVPLYLIPVLPSWFHRIISIPQVYAGRIALLLRYGV